MRSLVQSVGIKRLQSMHLLPTRRMLSIGTERWKEVKPETKLRNAITAIMLMGFVGGVYYTALQKMAQKVC